MYLIETYIDKSPIHGIGVFANQEIKKDQLIWRQSANDLFFFPFKDKEAREIAKEFPHAVKYGYYDKSGLWFCPADSNCYVNHSDEPNTYESDDSSKIFASRDISIGEEITENYKTFMSNSFFSSLGI